MRGRSAVPALVVVAAVALSSCTSSSSAGTALSASIAPPTSVGPPSSSDVASTSAPAARRSSGARRPSTHPVVAPTGSKAPYPTPGKVPALKPDQRPVLNALPGSSSPSCTAVDSHPDVHSGQLAMGNFVAARRQYKATVHKSEVPMLDMYVIPAHAGHLTRLVVTLQPLGGGAKSTVTSTSVQTAESSRFFALQLPVRAAGTYRIAAVSGQDRGCFIARF